MENPYHKVLQTDMRLPKVTDWLFARPELAQQYLQVFEFGLISATALYARRRMGKTEFLTTAKLKAKDSLRAFEALHRVPELFRRFLSQYLSNPFDGVDLAIEICEQSVYVEEGFQLRWQVMLPVDWAILRLIADGNRTLHGADTLQRLGEVLGLPGSANRNVPQNSLRRLRSRQMIIQVEPGVYRFEDDAFRAWVLNEASE